MRRYPHRLTPWGNRLKLATIGAVMSFLKRLWGARAADEPIIIVSGLPRSGTSMLMRMLAAGGIELVVDGLRTADTDNPKGYYELERVKELDKKTDTSWLADTRGKGLKVISFLLQHLPPTYDYKVIFLRRSLPEVLASQQKMLDRRGEPPGETSDADMADLFTAHLTKVETQLASRANCEVLYVEHRRAVSEPAVVAGQIGQFLGGGLDVEAMAAAVDTALYRNRA